MIGRHLFGMHSEISEFDMCKFENNNGVNSNTCDKEMVDT